MKTGTAKCVAAERTEDATVGTGSTGDVNWDEEVGSVVSAQTEVVFTNSSTGGEHRRADLIWPVGSDRTDAGLLDTRVDGEWEAAGDGGDAEQLPATSYLFGHAAETRHAAQWQILPDTGREDILDIEGGSAFFGTRVEWVLRERDG